MQDIIHAYVGGLTAKRGEDGILRVKGLATDDTLDLDEQICDPEWLKTAMPAWMEIGNIREMHQSKAVGKAVEMEQTGTGFVVEARVVDKEAAMKVEEGIYTGFSVGIKGARVVKDASAPGGRIISGKIVEVSLVDRPANPSAVIEIAKTVNGELVKGSAVDDFQKSPDMNTDAVMTEEPGASPELYERTEQCNACAGTGKKSNVEGNTQETDCEVCNGSGEQPKGKPENIIHGDPTIPVPLENRKVGKTYNPDQPRDDHGRWGEGGDGKQVATSSTSGTSYDSHMTAADEHIQAGEDTGDEKQYEAAQAHSEAAHAIASGAPNAGAKSDAAWAATRAAGNPYKTATANVKKKDYSDKERADAADAGEALPDGSFPIKTVGDLKNAIQSFGRAKDPAKAKKHIMARAMALGKPDLIPDNWKGADAELVKADDMQHDPADLSAVRAGLIALIKAELDEMLAGDENEICDIQELLCSLSMFLNWWTDEASENETTAPFTGWDNSDKDDMNTYLALGVSADLVKYSGEDVEKRAELRTEIVKALGLEETITTKAELNEAKEQIELLKAALEDVKAMAAPGGPAIRATREQMTKSAQTQAIENEVNRLVHIAKTVTDPDLRNAYLLKADELRKSL